MKNYILGTSFLFLGLFSLSALSSDSYGKLSDRLTQRRNQSAKKVPKEMKMKMKAGVSQLKAQGLAKKALGLVGVGKKLPTINLIDSKKKRVSLNELVSGKNVVLTFYRGGWCPYCMLELDHYQKMYSSFQNAGADIIAISPDTPMESLKTKKKRNLSYSVLSDPNNRAAKQMGIAFKVDAETLKIYKGFGINLQASQGNDGDELPMPGTYVVDKKGVIRYSFVDPDYTKRAEPSEVLAVIKSLAR